MSVTAGDLLASKYKILRTLGAGGMGAVYLAENIEIGRQVAIKVLHANVGADPAARQRFRQEARTSALIAHPGIVDVLDMGETASGESFIVMERLDGQTLGARIKQRARLSLDEAVTIIAEALDAIAAAHDKGVVHRDLKPDNVFLVWSPRWCVKILDFGISRLVTDEVRLTASNMVMGSVLYMPPEQARDAKSAGPAADIYALGATLYHALAGVPPFLGETYTEVLSRLLSDDPVPLAAQRADLPPAFCDLVMRMLAKDPAARPGSAREVRAALLAFVPTPIVPEAPVATGLLATAPAMSSRAGELAETADASSPPALAALGTAPGRAPADPSAPALAAGTPPPGAGSDAARVGGTVSGVPSAANPPHAVSVAIPSPAETRAVPSRRRRTVVVVGAASLVLVVLAVALVNGRGDHAASTPAAAGSDARADGRDDARDDAGSPDAPPSDATVDAAAYSTSLVPADARRVIEPTRPAHRVDAGSRGGDATAATPDASHRYQTQIIMPGDPQVPVQPAP